MLTVFVPGQPAPQGSKRYVGRGIMVESSKQVKSWRSDIRCALLTEGNEPLARFDGPVKIDVEFVMKRPTSAPKKITPPAVKRPDLDKLVRAVLDAISSAGIWGDDSQVIQASCSKRIAEINETPGCHLLISHAQQ